MKEFVRTCLVSILLLGIAAAQTAPVQRRANGRISQSAQRSSLGVLNPHSQLDLLDSAPTDGFCHVRTQRGLEGWIWGRNVQFQRVSVQPIFHLSLHSHLALPWYPLAAMGWDEDCPVDKDGCRCYQHKDDDGNCKDDPGTSHHHGHYEPEPGEQCWVIVECLCREGQSPSGNSCTPCSYSGEDTVCSSR